LGVRHAGSGAAEGLKSVFEPVAENVFVGFASGAGFGEAADGREARTFAPFASRFGRREAGLEAEAAFALWRGSERRRDEPQSAVIGRRGGQGEQE